MSIKRNELPAVGTRLTLAEKCTRLRLRMDDPEWRRYAGLICIGKAIGISLVILYLFAFPVLWKMGSAMLADGVVHAQTAAAEAAVVAGDLADNTKNPVI